jgi:CheY-like chemotaxis protein
VGVKLLILVVDDEPDVEELFRQQFRRDLRAGLRSEIDTRIERAA